MGWMKRKSKNGSQRIAEIRSRLWGMIENFILCLLNLRLLMRHASGDSSQTIAFVWALNPFCVLSQHCPYLGDGGFTPI